MRTVTLVVALLMAAPALAQPSRLYTNEDLGKAVTTASNSGLSPADAAAILAPYQYQAPPTPARAAWGPSVYVMRSSPTAGPFGEFAPFPLPRRLDGTSYRDPPWLMQTYLGRPYGRFGASHPPAASRTTGPTTRDTPHRR